MIKKTLNLFTLSLALAASAITAARAADNVIGKQNDTAQTPYAIRAVDVGADSSGRRIYLYGHTMFGSNNVELFTSSNPGVFTLSGPLPLPVGAATEAKLEAVRALLAAPLNVNLPTNAATATGQATSNAALGTPSDTAWDGSSASSSLTSIFKAVYAKVSGLLTVDTVVRSTALDVGGTITTANTAQTFSAASPTARGVVFQNHSTSDLYYTCSGSPATLDYHSIKIPAGALHASDAHHASTTSCSVIGATAGQAFYARRF